jgi:nondiscriminating aspartyl-tRNA synthetase
VTGTVAVNGGRAEVQAQSVEVTGAPAIELPFEINVPDITAGLDVQLVHRVMSLRHPRQQAIFHVQEIVADTFRTFLRGEGFIEVHTPKIVATGTEGGAELFPLQYFEQKAYLAQSPQFYKEMLVASGFERVFEVAPVYRAEEHNTSRHLNEYVSLDMEMGFINDDNTLMDIENDLMDRLLTRLATEGKHWMEEMGVTVPAPARFPRIPLDEILHILEKEYGKISPDGLDPEGERLICKYTEEKYGSLGVFVTSWPVADRPVYAFRDPEKPGYTKSFDLLFNGLEVTTGGLRMHDPAALRASFRERGYNPDNYATYLEAFDLAMPPHGGFAIGLERLTGKLLNLNNVRESVMFPRDRTRLTP